MKKFVGYPLSLLIVFVRILACTMDNSTILFPNNEEKKDGSPADSSVSRLPENAMLIRVGAATFSASLLNNPAAAAFNARLPMTLSMKELNGNEKFAQLPADLPTRAANPGTIQNGDLMLYGSATLVLFYKTFPTSYSYTKLGRVDNPAGLTAALGAEGITVTFERK